MVFADSRSLRVTGLVLNSRISARPYTAVFLFAWIFMHPCVLSQFVRKTPSH